MIWLLVWVMLLNVAYVAAMPSASLFYVANVLLHLGLGTAVVLWLVWKQRDRRTLLLAAAGFLGVYLMFVGATRDHRIALWAHISLGLLGIAFIKPRWSLSLAGLVMIAAGLRFGGTVERIRNPQHVPLTMAEEGGGPKSPFWPSSARTNTGTTIPSDFFMDSAQCGECHKDIYDQWKSSVHHFASFNNQFYKASILHMQDLSGTQGSKWCASCHDHAVFFNGRFERPIKEQLDTPEAQNGLGCVSCHSITHVNSTMGNGDFEIMYPPLHRLASSKHPIVRQVDRFFTYLNPEPHRRTFLKPFMKLDNAEYCSGCHKVHLDEPVNNYRWIRGFNEYDNWQASGISGQGARSFYYPKQSMVCNDCHMPLVASEDPGNREGKVHSHRFAAANMAVAAVNKDQVQMSAIEQFLKSGFITVDLFAASPVEEKKSVEVARRRASDAPNLASTYAVGEESEQGGPVTLREVGKIAAPLDAPGVSLKPGDTVRIDAVVRTRKTGHFFPAGTVDSFDVWLEFQALDANGQLLAQSGQLEDGESGPVEKGAHFYRSYQLDGAGNHINKRNAWQTRSTLYVRLIPPGAADTVHYLVKIPKDAVGPVTFVAQLKYRKFSDYYTKYSYTGVAQPGSVDRNHDSREYRFDPAKSPTIPILTLNRATVNVPLGEPQWQPKVLAKDRERWNDWGIGLLLQGDLKGAEYAFARVAQAEPGYADAYVNSARALVQEGQTEAAKPLLQKALSLSPNLARAEFFLGVVQKTEGDYDGALKTLADVRRQHPRDRVVANTVGRILFLQRRYAEAVPVFQEVLAIDPEDVQAHYNLMLCYRGLAQPEQAEREEKLFRRFKADESAQALTGKPRQTNPEDNNERQSIHDHVARPVSVASVQQRGTRAGQP